MKVLFHTNTLNYRGTTVAVTDYAKYNQEILGNQSVIMYNKGLGFSEKDMGSEHKVVETLSNRFQVVGYDEDTTIQNVVDTVSPDVTYFIRAGQIEPLPSSKRNVVHSVFQFYDPHGDRYAYVSKWLSDEMTSGRFPYVPHIVNLPQPSSDYREILGIPKDKIVVGRIGGYFTFDIDGVKNTVTKLANESDKFVFLFVGTEPFVDHPNVRFINEIHDLQKKSNFISTCDCMLHARQRGESFGLSIAEFLSLNKPVLAWNGGYDKNHIEMLKDSGTLYSNEDDLKYMLNNLKDFSEDWTKRVEEFKPANVMKKFDEVFLSDSNG